METHKVELGGVTLHGYADMPDPFVGLAVTAVNGWRGLPGSRGDNDPIPGAHGSYEADVLLRESRSIEVRAAAIALSESAALAMVDEVEAVLAGRPVEMWVTDAQGAWRRSVEVETVQIVGAYNRDRVQFAIDAFAPDPRRYQAVETVGPVGLPTLDGGLILPKAFPWDFGTLNRQVATVHNRGAVPLLPVITVNGSADELIVRGGSFRMVYGEFSGTLVFDSRERRAWLNGGDVTRQMLLRGWPVVQPGETAAFDFEVVGGSPGINLTVSYEIGAW